MDYILLMRFGSAVLITLLSCGCGVTLRPGRPAELPPGALAVNERQAARCVRSPSGVGKPYRESLPGAVTEPELLPYLARLTPSGRRAATAAGVEPLFARLLRERSRAAGAPTPEALELRQELDERLAALPGQLLATEFECECVIGAINSALEEHDEIVRRRERDLTIATLVTGAGFGLGSGVWDLANEHAQSPAAPDGPIIAAIAGAAVTSALGAAILIPRPREIVFVHEHNLLAPMVTGADDGRLYPTFVLRLLTLPMADGAATPRDELLKSWNALWSETVGASDRKVAEQIVYGSGGVYDPVLLELRRRLFEELESTLDSLSRDIDLLNREIGLALRTSPET